jgi:hypothetical protein
MKNEREKYTISPSANGKVREASNGYIPAVFFGRNISKRRGK